MVAQEFTVDLDKALVFQVLSHVLLLFIYLGLPWLSNF